GLATPDESGWTSLLDQGEAIDVEEPEVGDLHVRNDRKWQEGHLEGWFRERAAEIARRAAKREQARAYMLEGVEAHEPRKGQRQLRPHLTVAHHDKPAFDVDQAVH